MFYWISIYIYIYFIYIYINRTMMGRTNIQDSLGSMD